MEAAHDEDRLDVHEVLLDAGVEPSTRETMTPEERGRINIDKLLGLAGWEVQDLGGLNVHAACGVAVREFPLEHENTILLQHPVQREADPTDLRITFHVVNMARAGAEYRYSAVNAVFAGLRDGIRPHVVHVGLLKHACPAVYLHDNEKIIGSTMSGTRVWDVPEYGIYVGRPPSAADTSASDCPTHAIPSADPG